jgi:hypothetical protein
MVDSQYQRAIQLSRPISINREKERILYVKQFKIKCKYDIHYVRQ